MAHTDSRKLRITTVFSLECLIPHSYLSEKNFLLNVSPSLWFWTLSNPRVIWLKNVFFYTCSLLPYKFHSRVFVLQWKFLKTFFCLFLCIVGSFLGSLLKPFIRSCKSFALTGHNLVAGLWFIDKLILLSPFWREPSHLFILPRKMFLCQVWLSWAISGSG